MRERILAIVGALALVAVAVALRAQLADDDTTGGDRAGGGGGRPVVACTRDLMDVCDALVADGRIAADPPELDLGPEAAAARVGDRRIDGWVTWDPAPGIANFDAEGGGDDPRWTGSAPVGGSVLGVANASNRGYSIEGCPTADFDWSCLARSGARFGVGVPSTSEGLARLHPLAQALLTDGVDFTDLPSTDLARVVESANPEHRDDFAEQLRLLRAARGTLDFVVGPMTRFDDVGGVRAWSPSPDAEVVVVLAWRDGAAVEGLADRFESDRVEAALRGVGVEPGAGTLAPEGRAGELFQVRQKVG